VRDSHRSLLMLYRLRSAACVVAILTMFVSTAHSASSLTLFVSPAGHGTVCEKSKPCTLTTAQRQIRTLVPQMSDDLIVSFAAGRYRLREPLSLQPQDSGRNGYVVSWQGSDDGKTILDGAVRITNWRLVNAGKNLWRAPVPHGAYALQIYVNGRRAVRARRGGCKSPTECKYTETGLSGGGAALATLAHPEELVAVFGVRWRDFHCRVQSVAGNDIQMAQPCWHNTVVDSVKNGWSNASPKGKPFKGIDWFENAYEFLGSPGQFYIDRRKDVVYYVPQAGEDLKTADVEMPLAEHLLNIDGTSHDRVHDIEVRNITFKHAGWLYAEAHDGYVPLQAGYLITGVRNNLPDNGEGMWRLPAAVEVSGGQRIQFVHDKFLGLGAAGIGFAGGTRDSIISHCNFQDLSGGAIFIGDTVASPKSAEDRSGGNVVSRNTISHIAVEYRDNVAIMGGFNDGLTIDHNSISDVPYSGISVGWGWNYEGGNDTQHDIRIRSNRLSKFMLTLHDGGAIYTQAQSPGSTVTENYIDYRGTDNGNGIYLDERSRKFDVCGNVVWDIPVSIQEGQWVSTWSSWSGDLDIHDNWSNDPHLKLHNPGPSKSFHENHLGLKVLPPEAQAVIDASGAAGSDVIVTACGK